MGTRTEIVVGYDRRCWARFTVKDATPEEIAMLEMEDSTEALVMAAQMDREGRLDYQYENQDDSPEFFDMESSAVIEFEQHEDEEV